MAYFPFFQDITNKECLVIGGGRVALRKVRTLRDYGALVTVAAGEICPEIRQILPEERCLVNNLDRETLSDLLNRTASGGLTLVVAASSSREINHLTADFCHEKGIPVNVIDMPSECSFIFPAVVRRGPVSIGINSGTESPALSRKIREEIEAAVPPYYGEIAIQLGQVREYVKGHFPREEDRRRILTFVAARAFSYERKLTEEEVEALIGRETETPIQGKTEHGTIG